MHPFDIQTANDYQTLLATDPTFIPITDAEEKNNRALCYCDRLYWELLDAIVDNLLSAPFFVTDSFAC
jgi:hypothetical protein